MTAIRGRRRLEQSERHWLAVRHVLGDMARRAQACTVRLELLELSSFDGTWTVFPAVGLCEGNERVAELRLMFVVEVDVDAESGVCVRLPMSTAVGRGKTVKAALRDLSEAIKDAAAMCTFSELGECVDLSGELDTDLDAGALQLLRVTVELTFQ